MNNIVFGTEGWRAIIDKDFTVDNVKMVAQATADYVNSITDKKELRGKELIVGYDTRRNSKIYAESVAEVLAANGIKVILTDRVTGTPAVSFAIKDKNLTGGVMITASHNPAAYNGFKYKAYYGGSADSGIIGKIEAFLGRSEVKTLTMKEAIGKGLLKMYNAMPSQIDFITKYVNMGLISKSGFNVLIDSMYGAGGYYLEDILKKAGCRAKTIHGEPDVGFGGINPEPIDKNLKDLMKMTKDGGYDIGIATDGDADRVACVTPDGGLVNGQNVMALLLWHFVEDRKEEGSVVTTICGTSLLSRMCKKYGLKLHETKVGFKYICDIMRRENVLVGGEETGGIGFKGCIPERDGIMSGLLMLEMMAYKKRALLDIIKEMTDEFGSHYYMRTSIKFAEEKKRDIMNRLENMRIPDVLGRKVVNLSKKDGLKFMCEDDSWLLFRLSGTEPILRVYSEAETEEKSSRILEYGKKLVLGM